MSNIFTVHHGRTYRAQLKLSFFESFASEEDVAEKFEEFGFINVVVTGQGATRYAHGVWNGPDESVPLTDEHVVSVVEQAQGAAAESQPTHEYPGGGSEFPRPYDPFNPAHPGTEDTGGGG